MSTDPVIARRWQLRSLQVPRLDDVVVMDVEGEGDDSSKQRKEEAFEELIVDLDSVLRGVMVKVRVSSPPSMSSNEKSKGEEDTTRVGVFTGIVDAIPPTSHGGGGGAVMGGTSDNNGEQHHHHISMSVCYGDTRGGDATIPLESLVDEAITDAEHATCCAALINNGRKHLLMSVDEVSMRERRLRVFERNYGSELPFVSAAADSLSGGKMKRRKMMQEGGGQEQQQMLVKKGIVARNKAASRTAMRGGANSNPEQPMYTFWRAEDSSSANDQEGHEYRGNGTCTSVGAAPSAFVSVEYMTQLEDMVDSLREEKEALKATIAQKERETVKMAQRIRIAQNEQKGELTALTDKKESLARLLISEQKRKDEVVSQLKDLLGGFEMLKRKKEEVDQNVVALMQVLRERMDLPSTANTSDACRALSNFQFMKK